VRHFLQSHSETTRNGSGREIVGAPFIITAFEAFRKALPALCKARRYDLSDMSFHDIRYVMSDFILAYVTRA
jgi:hypothetical protein